MEMGGFEKCLILPIFGQFEPLDEPLVTTEVSKHLESVKDR
jgi:hypothetical protein